MTDRLTRNVLSAAGQTIVQTFVLLILYRYLLDNIGVEKLGVWSVVLATASVARVSELGMAGSVTKFVATYRSKGDDHAAADILQTAALCLGAVVGIVLILAYPGLLWALPHVLPATGLDAGLAILPYGLVSLWLTAVSSIWMSGLDGCLRSDLRAGVMILGSFTLLLMSLASVERYGLVGLALAQVAQGGILVILGWVVVRLVMPSLPFLPVKWKAVRFREMFGYGVNFQINSIIMLLFEPTTKILLGRYGGLSAAGYFEMAQRLVLKVRALVVESNRVIVPVFAGVDACNGETSNLYVRNMRCLFFLITPLFAVLLAFAPAISEVWIGSFQRQFVLMVVCLTMAWYLNSITAPAYFAYLGQGKLRWVTVAHVVMGTVNIVVGLILGYYLGWHGVVAAFVVALVLGSLIPCWTYHYENKLGFIDLFSWADIILATVCLGSAVVMFGGYWFMSGAEFAMWTRIVSLAVGMGIVVATAIWLHPLRRQIYIMAKSRLYRV